MVSLSSAFVKSSALPAVEFLTLLLLCGALSISPLSAQPQTLSNSAVSDTGAATSQRQAEATEDAARTEAEQAAATARSLEISREIARRETLIDDLRYSAGVYSEQLREVQEDLGAYLLEVGDFEKAAQIFTEALQIARINTGLYSEDQLPPINAPTPRNTKTKAWPHAPDFQSLHIHIADRSPSTADARPLHPPPQHADRKSTPLNYSHLKEPPTPSSA